jgi:hypothetical protein
MGPFLLRTLGQFAAFLFSFDLGVVLPKFYTFPGEFVILKGIFGSIVTILTRAFLVSVHLGFVSRVMWDAWQDHFHPLHGRMSHRMGSLVPPTGMTASCNQIFILDEAMQVQARMGQRWAAGLNAAIVLRLGCMLQRVNEFVHHFRAAASDVRANAYMRIADNRSADRRRYNRPTVSSEIAVFIPDSTSQTFHGSNSLEALPFRPKPWRRYCLDANCQLSFGSLVLTGQFFWLANVNPKWGQEFKRGGMGDGGLQHQNLGVCSRFGDNPLALPPPAPRTPSPCQ